MIKSVLLVGLGGALGSMARYITQRYIAENTVSHFPWGTFTVNLAGCFLIGILWGALSKPVLDTTDWKLFLMTGVCGGFTTFSAFTLEGIDLLKAQRQLLFFLYVGGSVILGLILTYAGARITKMNFNS